MAFEADRHTEVQYLKGVGPVRAQQLRRLGLERAEDLLFHFPAEYLQRGGVIDLARVRVGEIITTQGQVLDVQKRRVQRGRTLVTVTLGDAGARLRLTWFNAAYLADKLRVGESLVVSGAVTLYAGQPQMVNPEFDQDTQSELVTSGPVPRYPLTAGLKQGALRKIIEHVLDTVVQDVPEPLPDKLREREQLMPRIDALREIHRPSDVDRVERARARFAFEEAFALQLAVGIRRHGYLRRSSRIVVDDYGTLSTKLVNDLGFELTGAQRRVLSAIGKDLRSKVAMHRLVQGDVGCGKTLVAVIAMVWTIEAGGQVAFLAPTEVLARQHGRRQGEVLKKLGVKVATLTGATPSAERRDILKGLATGYIQAVFGTHALIQDDIHFRRLGLAVVDEQHRFGVAQRGALAQEGAHLLVMSATPIPRTLALTVYGDLDLSVIDELPPGRSQVGTRVISDKALAPIYEDVVARAGRAEQSYLVFPVVEENEGSDLASAKAAFEELKSGPLSALRLALLHGKIPPREKAQLSEAFARGEYDAVVATTVVEVGLDVAKATLMVVHQAERFGLAQLHQLRGRVGRSHLKSECVLVSGPGLGQRARQRLQLLASTHDGFLLAEADLRERGMGDLHGFRQHGRALFRALNPLQDELILTRARESAREILEADPGLRSGRHASLATWLDELGGRSPFWSASG